MNTTGIYALIDPRTGDICYIGQSMCPESRLQQHLADSDSLPKVHWIQELCQAGLKPRCVVFAHGLSHQEALNAERAWIQYGKRMGWPLTNQVHVESINKQHRVGGRFGDVVVQIQGDFTRASFANLLGISEASLCRYINGEREPGTKVFIRLLLLAPREQKRVLLNLIGIKDKETITNISQIADDIFADVIRVAQAKVLEGTGE